MIAVYVHTKELPTVNFLHIILIHKQGCATGAMVLHTLYMYVDLHLPLKRHGISFQRQCHRWAVRNDLPLG